jgi:gliding motility-associated-like protein
LSNILVTNKDYLCYFFKMLKKTLNIISPFMQGNQKKSFFSLPVTFTGFLLLFWSLSGWSQCPPNVGFEQNNFTGWTGFTGTHNGTLPVNTPTMGIVAGRHTITTGGNDGIIPAIPQVCPLPGFGSRSVRLGNSGTGAQAERLVTSFLVTPNTSALLFAFAVILQDPGHGPTQQPRFELNITLPNQQNTPCGNFVYVASNNLPGFITQGSTRYRNWAQQSINLIPFIGQTVNVNVLTADCSPTAHYGYAYFDMTCDIFQVIRRFCPGDQDAILTAPSGFSSYVWSPTGQTTQSILVPNPVNNSVYTVTMVPIGGNPGCAVTIRDTIRLMGATTSVINNTCNGATAASASIQVTGGTPFYNYTWSTTPVQTAATATGLAAGTYTARIIDAAQCTVNVSVTLVDPPPIANTRSSTPVSCFGGSNGTGTVNMIGGSPPFIYSWNSTPVQNTSTATGLGAGTWTVSVTDQGGCTNQLPVVVSGPSQLISSVTHSNVLCNGASSGTGLVVASGGVGNYNYSWNTVPPQNNANAINLSAGTYIATVTDGNNCTATNTIIVDQPPAIVTSTTTTPVSCFGGSNATATVTANGGVGNFTYVWNSTPTQNTQTANNLSATTYTVTVTDGNGCVQQNTAVPIQPTAMIVTTSFTPVTCFGIADGSVTVSAQDGTPGYNFSWNTIPVQVGATINSLRAGTYTATVTDANGCSQTQSVVVTEPTLLTVSQSTTPVSCYGGIDGTATASGNGGTTPYAYLWTTSPNQATPTAVGLSLGTYRVTVTDANNCTATAVSSITEPTPVTLTTTFTDALCFGSADGTVAAQGYGGTPGYTYSWNTVPVQNTQTATGLTIGTYQVTVTDLNNCTALGEAVVLQPTQLNGVTTYTPALCFGSADGTASAEAFQGTPGYSYSWNTVPVQNSQTAVGLAAGNYTVTITDNHNCSIQRNVLITEPTQVTLTSSYTATLCFGSSDGTATILPSGGTPGYTYIWSTSPIQQTQTAEGLRAGTYTVNVRDLNNCPAQSQVIVTEPVQLDGQIIVQNVRCFGESNGAVTAQGINGVGPYMYAWQTEPPQNLPTASNLKKGVYSVRITDMNGCFINRTATVTEPALLEGQAYAESPTCWQGQDGKVWVTTKGGTQPYFYRWNNDYALNQSTLSNVHYGWHWAMTIDNNGCARKDSIYVTQPDPIPKARVFNDTICTGESAFLKAYSQIPGHKVFWYYDNGDGAAFYEGNTHRTQAIYGQKIFFVRTEDDKGCQSPKIPVFAIVKPLPIANFEADKLKWELPDAIFTFTDKTKAAAGVASYTWEFGDGKVSNLKDPVHQYNEVGQYHIKLTVVDSNGCINEIEKLNYIEVGLLVGVVPPNAFSPNGDGANDYFYVESSKIRSWTIKIYDRWGNQVYESDDLLFRWDGTQAGTPLTEGTYVYYLTGIALDGTKVGRSGSILLIR